MADPVHPAIGIVGAVGFGVASLGSAIVFVAEAEAAEKRIKCGSARTSPTFSKRLLMAHALAQLVLSVTYWALYMEVGFFDNGSVIVWWPRYIAEALATGLVVYTLGIFSWCKPAVTLLASFAAALGWLVGGLLPALSNEAMAWGFYAIGVVVSAKLFGVTLLKLYRRRDNIADYCSVVFACLSIGALAFLAFTVGHSNHIPLHISEGIYLAYDGVLFIFGACCILTHYIPKKRAHIR